MTKKKVTTKSVKSKTPTVKRSSNGHATYATEHDFIIIAGGGLVVMILVTMFMLGLV